MFFNFFFDFVLVQHDKLNIYSLQLYNVSFVGRQVRGKERREEVEDDNKSILIEHSFEEAFYMPADIVQNIASKKYPICLQILQETRAYCIEYSFKRAFYMLADIAQNTISKKYSTYLQILHRIQLRESILHICNYNKSTLQKINLVSRERSIRNQAVKLVSNNVIIVKSIAQYNNNIFEACIDKQTTRRTVRQF